MKVDIECYGYNPSDSFFTIICHSVIHWVNQCGLGEMLTTTKLTFVCRQLEIGKKQPDLDVVVIKHTHPESRTHIKFLNEIKKCLVGPDLQKRVRLSPVR